MKKINYKIAIASVMLFFFCTNLKVQAQSSSCGPSAPTITPTHTAGCLTNINYAIPDGDSTTLSMPVPSCASGAQTDGWYQFTADTNFTTINIQSAHSTATTYILNLILGLLPTGTYSIAQNPAIAVYSSCSPGSLIACINNNTDTTEIMFFPTIPGNTYYVRIMNMSHDIPPNLIDLFPTHYYNNISGFFCIHDGYPLSVKWLNFSGYNNENTNVLNWVTASESNSAYFKVERSGDAEDFVPIGQVAAAGNSATQKQYQFTDNEPIGGINYYRLKEVDVNGRYFFSKTIAINSELTGFHLLKIFPNPTKSQFTINCFAGKNCQIAMQIINMQGKALEFKALTLKKGYNNIAYTFRKSLSAGSYLIRLIDRKTEISHYSYIYKQ